MTAGIAFKMENDAVVYPLKLCTIAGNLYECLKAVLAIGNDTKSFGNVVCPSMLVDRVVVST